MLSWVVGQFEISPATPSFKHRRISLGFEDNKSYASSRNGLWYTENNRTSCVSLFRIKL